MHGYCSQRFLLRLKEGKARWPPIPFRDMLPKPEGLPPRTDKVKAAGAFTPGSIVSLQMGQPQWNSSRGYPALSLSLSLSLTATLDLADWSALFGSCCCYCSYWITQDLGFCAWVFGLSFPGGFKGCDNKVSNKEVSFHSNRYPSSLFSVPIAGVFLAIVLYEDPLVFLAVFLGQPYFCTCCFLTA